MATDIIDPDRVLMLGIHGAGEVDVDSTAAWIRVDVEGLTDLCVLAICFLNARVDR